MAKKSKGHSKKSSGSNGISIGVTAKRRCDILTSVGFLEASEDEEFLCVHVPASFRSNTCYREKEERYQKKERQQRRKDQKKSEKRRLWEEDTEDARPIDYDDMSHDCENGLVGEYQSCNDGKKYDGLPEIVDEDEHTFVSQFSHVSE